MSEKIAVHCVTEDGEELFQADVSLDEPIALILQHACARSGLQLCSTQYGLSGLIRGDWLVLQRNLKWRRYFEDGTAAATVKVMKRSAAEEQALGTPLRWLSGSSEAKSSVWKGTVGERE